MAHSPTATSVGSVKFSQLPPLALYIHVPWCVKKCPYCDFNSHVHQGTLPIADYVDALKLDLDQDRHLAQGRKLTSIFFGGGTPSLLPASAIGEILEHANNTLGFESDIEITLEANPGTTEYDSFQSLINAGLNRLSLGIQSFDDTQLQRLGRIHSSAEACQAIANAQSAGFENINLDLMYALPEQSVEAALADLRQAVSFGCQHQSWYQLTIEPNTEFYRRPPVLPAEGTQWEIQEAGLAFLHAAGFERYEISAFCRDTSYLGTSYPSTSYPGTHASRHNLNYWQFGDYLGIGAGAHAKITREDGVFRFSKTRLPKDYLARKTLNSPNFLAHSHCVDDQNLLIDFMMNALRLRNGLARELFEKRTGLTLSSIESTLEDLQQRDFLLRDKKRLCCSEKGYNFLDSVLQSFMPE